MELETRSIELVRKLPLQSTLALVGIFGGGVLSTVLGAYLISIPSTWIIAPHIFCGGIVSLVFGVLLIRRRHAAHIAIKRMLSADLLAHWTYTEEEWKSYCRLQRRIQRTLIDTLGFRKNLVDSITMGLVSGGIVGLVVWVDSYSKEWSTPLHRYWPLWGAIAFLLGFSLPTLNAARKWLGDQMWRKSLNKGRSETFISSRCLLVHNQIYEWGNPDFQLESVSHLQHGDGTISTMEFTLSAYSKYERVIKVIDVPVPDSQREMAEKLPTFLQS